MFKLTQRMFVEARSGQDLMSFVHLYYGDNPEDYDGINVRVDDLIFQAEEEWTELFGGVTEVEFTI